MNAAEPVNGPVRRGLRVACGLLMQRMVTIGAYHCGMAWRAGDVVLRERRIERALWAELGDMRAQLAELDRARPPAPPDDPR